MSTMNQPSATPRAPCIALLSNVLDLRYLVPAFDALCPDIDWRLQDNLGNRADIDAAICWNAPAGILATLPNLRLIQSIAAGVDHIYADSSLPEAIPVCRVVDPGMAAGMSAYVAWAVINRQRHFTDYVANHAAAIWRESPIIAPSVHRVGIAGMGNLGTAAARALTALGYRVSGWSRSEKTNLPQGVTGYHGTEGLTGFLAGADTLVCLLPLTQQTRGFLNARTFEQLPSGAHIVNVGRGAHLVEADLLAALDSGQLSAATLDAVEVEPMPANHVFWRRQDILVTPHIATRTPATTIAAQALSNIAAARAGLPVKNAASRDQGY